MTREEEIKQAAQRATNYGSSCNNYAYLNFIEGAEWADGHPSGSVIRWQTGEPKEAGLYFIQFDNGTFDIQRFIKGFDFLYIYSPCASIIAWCPLSEIKPYKEDQP